MFHQEGKKNSAGCCAVLRTIAGRSLVLFSLGYRFSLAGIDLCCYILPTELKETIKKEIVIFQDMG